jgi:hypothetical protein
MDLFIKKLGLVLSVFSLSLLSLVFCIHLIMRAQFNFKIDKKKEFLIFGHSHAANAFNDEFIPNFKNLAKAGENYFYNYQKLKEVLPTNTTKAIFIEFTNRSIGLSSDKAIWNNNSMKHLLPMHTPFMNLEDLYLLYQKNPEGFIKVIGTSTRYNLTRILSFNYTINFLYGGHEASQGIIDPTEKEKKRYRSDGHGQEEEIAKYNLIYLSKIIDLCNKYNCDIYFIRSPQQSYYPKFNEKELLSLKEREFKDIEFLDFDNFPLSDDGFQSLGHLNSSGSKVFSIWFSELVEKDLLFVTDKQKLIDIEIKARTHNNVYKK